MIIQDRLETLVASLIRLRAQLEELSALQDQLNQAEAVEEKCRRARNARRGSLQKGRGKFPHSQTSVA
jgi:23S rRNA maturation mini-RNase III